MENLNSSLPNNSEDNKSETEPSEDKKVLRDFSKRYSLSARQNLADEIRELRFNHAKKESGNEDRLNSIEEHKVEIETLKETQVSLEEDLSLLHQEVEMHKGRLLSKIKDFFKRAQLEQELEVDVKRKTLDQVKDDITNRLKMISEIEDVVDDASDLGLARQKVYSFYKEQSELKSAFESEKVDRDVETISRDSGCIFTHGIPTELTGMWDTGMNNPNLKSEGMSAEDKLSMLIGLEPTISVATLRKNETVLKPYYRFGVILKGGTILSAFKNDQLTKSEDLYNRRSKLIEKDRSTIQVDPKKNIDEAINQADKEYEKRRGLEPTANYNELVVESPQVAGLFIHFTQEDIDQLQQGHYGEGSKGGKDNFIDLMKYSDDFKLPMYAIIDGKMYQFDTRECAERGMENYMKNLKEFSVQEVFDRKKDFSAEEKKRYAESVVNKNPFDLRNTSDDFELVRYFKHENHDSFGMGSYKDFVQAQKRYQQELKMGIVNPHDPGTAESMLIAEDERLKLSLGTTAESAFWKRESSKRNKMKMFAIYGFAVEALEAGDTSTYKLAEDIVAKYGGSFEECKKLIADRTDEKGNFIIKDSDIPLSVRQKMAELEKAA